MREPARRVSGLSPIPVVFGARQKQPMQRQPSGFAYG
jgi:hypothetical protein